MAFRAPVKDQTFIFDHIVGFQGLSATEPYADATRDLAQQILDEAAKLAGDVLAPLNRAGDLTPAKLENGVVRTSPGFAEGYRAIAEGGWVGMSAAPEFGGMGLPITLATAVNEMFSGACLSLQLNPLLTQGQIEALEHHATDELKRLYLPKLTSGEWNGTMNLTEPGAGSDVGALVTKAVDNGDGTFAISGQKIFITWGDGDFMPNVCHLVLARLPDGGPGVKGISLFLVPKLLLDEAGEPGPRNGVRVVSLEHKMGLHGSPTCVMEYDNATGWLIGERHGGIKAMFTMMNNARLGVATQGVGVAEAACQQALAYALDRRQGKTPVPGQGTIIDHADVRRMLAGMKAQTFAARCIVLDCALALDMAKATSEPEWEARAGVLTPIAKAFGTDTGNEVTQTSIQIHGGMGFIEETGAAQLARDVRVCAIYEGTNGIQAADLVGRKMMDGGEAINRLIDEVQSGAEAAKPDHPQLAEEVWNAAESLREVTDWLVAQPVNDRFAGSVPYLRAFALVLGGSYHLRAACSDPAEREALATFFIRRMLPDHVSLLRQAHEGAAGLYAITAEELAV
ncbi:acyl-CoA dehydrogenase [Haematobacter missouriensis]|uniref:3-methylmercaptopropionyl-CoA dehydrogenase n=1 Tax=Haematobacter missouriensis TaxID=366616 RepID=A0A212AVY9_9RHOB|nr:acyl-CoA dehydrogenase [Haematobacter missouriensis]KFI33677.1 acyl-CoA dehydrogenase [Haematobacter missouriensis]OWJ75625.1 acyl-CoA dehydrogenase [Haematobacter missouriensis]OWJ85615.1 acyl-CoA dehydrogenase [Haematobacter missouriensis]